MGQLPLTDAGRGRRVLGVVLAAGAGHRMGAPKAALVVDGRRLVDTAVAALRAGGCDDVLAVVPAGVVVAATRTVTNPAAASGMRSSLAVALEHAGGADALAVLLVDTPGVDAAAVGAVVDRWRSAPDRAHVAVYNGRRGHPTVMDVVRWRAALASAGPDEGARAWLRAHPAEVVETSVAGDPADLDTPADLGRWRADHPRP